MAKDELGFEPAERERIPHNMRESYYRELENLVSYYYNADRVCARAEKFIRDNGLWEKYENEKDVPF